MKTFYRLYHNKKRGLRGFSVDLAAIIEKWGLREDFAGRQIRLLLSTEWRREFPRSNAAPALLGPLTALGQS